MEAGKAVAAGTIDDSQRNATINALRDFDYIQYVFFFHFALDKY
jgi:hypothetical protein